MWEQTVFRLASQSIRSNLRSKGAVNFEAVRFFSKENCFQQQNGEEEGHRKQSNRFSKALGALLIGGGVMVVYAQQDNDFRQLLKERAPFADGLVSFIAAEELSHFDYIVKIMFDLKALIVDDIVSLVKKQMKQLPKDEVEDLKKDAPEECEDVGKQFRAPHSVFKSMVPDRPDRFEEARTSELTPAGRINVRKVGDSNYKDKKQVDVSHMPPLHPVSLYHLENDINLGAETAILNFNKAKCYYKGYSKLIIDLLKEPLDKADPKQWDELKVKSELKEKALETAESAFNRTNIDVNEMADRLEEPNFPGNEHMREEITKNLERIKTQIESARTGYLHEVDQASFMADIWENVQEARNHFVVQIETLHPEFRITDRAVNIPESEVHLFIQNAVLTAVSLMTESANQNTVVKRKLEEAVEMSRAKNVNAIDNAIEIEVTRQKRKIDSEYYKKLLMIKAESERAAKKAVETAGQNFHSILEEALVRKEGEVVRRLQREFDEAMMEEKEANREAMAGVLGRLKGMDDLMRLRTCASQKIYLIWNASEALQAAVTGVRPQGLANGLQSLENEIRAIQSYTDGDYEIITDLLDVISEQAKKRGVYSVPVLKERFISVLRVAQKVGYIPEGGSSLLVMFFDYLKALMTITPANDIPCHELLNEPFDPEELDNFDILQRAKYFMDKGELFMVLRYLNLLKGASKAVSREFANELRLYLETKLIADALLMYTSAFGLAE